MSTLLSKECLSVKGCQSSSNVHWYYPVSKKSRVVLRVKYIFFPQRTYETDVIKKNIMGVKNTFDLFGACYCMLMRFAQCLMPMLSPR